MRYDENRVTNITHVLRIRPGFPPSYLNSRPNGGNLGTRLTYIYYSAVELGTTSASLYTVGPVIIA